MKHSMLRIVCTVLLVVQICFLPACGTQESDAVSVPSSAAAKPGEVLSASSRTENGLSREPGSDNPSSAEEKNPSSAAGTPENPSSAAESPASRPAQPAEPDFLERRIIFGKLSEDGPIRIYADRSAVSERYAAVELSDGPTRCLRGYDLVTGEKTAEILLNGESVCGLMIEGNNAVYCIRKEKEISVRSLSLTGEAGAPEELFVLPRLQDEWINEFLCCGGYLFWDVFVTDEMGYETGDCLLYARPLNGGPAVRTKIDRSGTYDIRSNGRCVFWNTDNGLNVLDPESMTVRSYPEGCDLVRSMRGEELFSGDLLLLPVREDRISVIDLKTGEEQKQLQLSAGISSGALVDGRLYVYITGNQLYACSLQNGINYPLADLTKMQEQVPNDARVIPCGGDVLLYNNERTALFSVSFRWRPKYLYLFPWQTYGEIRFGSGCIYQVRYDGIRCAMIIGAD